MKIAVIAPTHIPARRANTIQVMKMSQALAAAGHEVRLAVPGVRPSLGWEELARHYGLERRFPVEWLPISPWLRSYDYGLGAVRWARGWGADLVYTRLPQAAALASQTGQATLLEVHDLPQGVVGPVLFRLFLKGKGARRLVAITRALAQDLSKRYGAPGSPPFTVIAPDGVDLSRYACLPEPEQARRAISFLNGKGFTAGYTGHLYAGRGAELLLELAAGLPQITFLLVGGEPEEVTRLQAQAGSRGLKNILLTGFVPNADLPAYQAACDVLLMPYEPRVAASSGGDISRYLSPMKLFEYLACGRAILSSDLPVLREVLSDENALLLPPGDVQAWAAALRRLQADPKLRATLGAAARQTGEGYSWGGRAARVLYGLDNETSRPLRRPGGQDRTEHPRGDETR